MTQVALLWHMHQPSYEDLVTREHILPWVRLHALKDYYGMAALLREFPGVRLTFNLVPSLLVQLEAFAANRAHDRYLEVGMKRAEDLTGEDAAFMLQNFFHAQRQRMIDVYPRYAQLLARRGAVGSAGEARTAARSFDVSDLRDLQVWQKLAWIDPFYLANDHRVRALIAKDRHFTEEDKVTLRSVELELLNAVIPEYRDAVSRGQIEISASPFYHPILPLLCDTDIYKVTHPDSRLPRRRFIHPEDATEQLTRAVACHERLFGQRPLGLWPSEGSVSDAMVPLVAQAGFEWMATDEMILARTLRLDLGRDADGHLNQPERLYVPYVLEAGGARVVCLFRDHLLSDLIGFSYAGWPADLAAGDFVSRLAEAGRRYAARTGGEEAVIPIILDGENAWEHFEGGGRPFLRALYGRLSNHPELRTVTMGEASRSKGRALTTIFPGSWIDANFYIWIGHQDDQRAWSQLAEAREILESARAPDPAAAARAREEILIAEGSDWFWWYGDDHSSDHDLEFDDLFRRHVRNVYRLLQRPVPDELFNSNISSAARASAGEPPTRLLAPTIDGEETSYFEWLGAGGVDVRQVAGAMHRTEQQPAILTHLRFGFDRETLFLRLDSGQPLGRILGQGYEIVVLFVDPEGLRLAVRQAPGAPAPVVWLGMRKNGDDSWFESPLRGARAAAGDVLELAAPVAALGVPPGGALSFVVALSDAAGQEVERHPASQPIDIVLPDGSFTARNWTA